MTEPARRPASYQAARLWFREAVPPALGRWPAARLEARPIPPGQDLTIDWAYAPPSGRAERLLILVTGLHGIEGFVGTHVLRLLVEEFLPRLDPTTAGVLLIHPLNPWGMQHGRKATAGNIDLNRNFLRSPAEFDPAFNPDYARLQGLLAPRRPLEAQPLASTRFGLGLGKAMLKVGAAVVQRAALLGQYVDPAGMYYGGASRAEEGRHLLGLLEARVPSYPAVCLLDIHSGFGAQRRLSLVHSTREVESIGDLRNRLGYPHVVKSDDRDFYAMRGDMIDGLYDTARTEWHTARFYASTFEFGTFGDSLPALARSLQAMVHENQQHHHGARSPRAARGARREFEALYAPADPAWWAAATVSARRAMEGILQAEGFVAP